MKQIALIGFGYQGIKAVAGVSAYHHMIKKVFVDNDLNLLENYALAGQRISVDFYYDREMWEPGYEVKLWLEEEENRNFVLNSVMDFTMLIFVTGLGGTMSLIARELSIFLKREKVDIPVYFVCSLPFREETDYQHNFLARYVLQYLRQNEAGWTVVDNNEIYRCYYNNYSTAYQNSSEYLTYLIDCVFCLYGPGMWNSKIDLPEIAAFLGKGLVHITVSDFEASTLPEYLSILQNRCLPYLPAYDTEKILMSLELSKGVRTPGILKLVNHFIDENFSDKCGISCRVFYGRNDFKECRIVLVTSGAETREQNISIREICLM